MVLNEIVRAHNGDVWNPICIRNWSFLLFSSEKTQNSHWHVLTCIFSPTLLQYRAAKPIGAVIQLSLHCLLFNWLQITNTLCTRVHSSSKDPQTVESPERAKRLSTISISRLCLMPVLKQVIPLLNSKHPNCNYLQLDSVTHHS